MKKRKILFIIAPIIAFVLITISLITVYVYNNNSYADDLFVYCDQLYDTDKDNEIIKYYPKLLFGEKCQYDLVSEYPTGATKEELYDTFLNKYIFAYLNLGDKKSFVNMYYDCFKLFRDDDTKYAQLHYMLVYEYNKDMTIADAIVEALDKVFYSTDDNKTKRDILDCESTIYSFIVYDEKKAVEVARKYQLVDIEITQ